MSPRNQETEEADNDVGAGRFLWSGRSPADVGAESLIPSRLMIPQLTRKVRSRCKLPASPTTDLRIMALVTFRLDRVSERRMILERVER
mmetsp:Transcript_20358/g.47733  ORF Transcript_20358/g.47733 Transcript_20358/m.47733 type:complete len:89 (+) Transcript_20358:2208-2474(+)